MNKLFLMCAGGLLGLLFMGVSNAASFDCAKAGTPFEKTICSNPNLSSMDDQLAQAYFAAKAATTNPDQFKAEQISWIKGARTCGTDVGCIENAYRIRMAQLAPQQSAPAPVAQQNSPQVDACVTRKVNAFRKEMGQTAPLNNDVLVEYRSDCEVNPNQQEAVVASSPAPRQEATSNSDSGGSGFFWLLALAVLGGGAFFFIKNKGSSSGGSDAGGQGKKEGGASFLKAMVNTGEMNRWKEETFNTQAKQNAKNDKIIKEIALKANPGMSEAAYDAMKAAEVAAKQAKKQEELDMKAADNAHWEGIAAGTIPAGTPPPSQVAYEAIPLEVRLQMEANKDALLIAQHNAEKARQHNARVDKTVNDLRNAEIFKTGQAEYLRQELEALKAKK